MEPELKRCTKCGEWKLTTEFSRKIGCKNNLDSRCKICIKKYFDNWRKKNRKKLNKATKLWRSKNKKRLYEWGKKWTENNREKSRLANRKWHAANKEKHGAAQKLWRKKHPKEFEAKWRMEYQQKKSTPKGALDRRMGCMVWHALHGNKFGRKWEELVGYTVEELRAHLESLFTEDMMWDAFLRGEIHVDHIVPKSRFKYDSPEDPEFKVCWSLSNLQPMWAKDNLQKNDKTMVEWINHKKKLAV